MVYLRWYVGEVGTAVYVVNIPACRPLLQKILEATNLASTTTQTNDHQYTTNQYGLNRYSRRTHDAFSPSGKKPSVSESEIHLADMHNDLLEFQGTQFEKEPRRQCSWLSDNEDQVVPDGAIMKTTKIVQDRK